ncbi:hypothetical protein Sjap_003957 [Stephania japonica]|uniref:Uncharacterized protein n=1 Tax=Stephania japonica TaxID=461633 RepID=A0AAP0KPS6_9MAGN
MASSRDEDEIKFGEKKREVKKDMSNSDVWTPFVSDLEMSNVIEVAVVQSTNALGNDLSVQADLNVTGNRATGQRAGHWPVRTVGKLFSNGMVHSRAKGKLFSLHTFDPLLAAFPFLSYPSPCGSFSSWCSSDPSPLGAPFPLRSLLSRLPLFDTVSGVIGVGYDRATDPSFTGDSQRDELWAMGQVMRTLVGSQRIRVWYRTGSRMEWRGQLNFSSVAVHGLKRRVSICDFNASDVEEFSKHRASSAFIILNWIKWRQFAVKQTMECPKSYIKGCRQYITCEICGIKELKKNNMRRASGDLLESDAQFQSTTSWGGRKRTGTSIVEMLPGCLSSTIEEQQ